jgi:hypothetical protein
MMTAGASAAALVIGPAHDHHQVHEPSRRAGRTYPLSGGAAVFWTRSRVLRRHSRVGDGGVRRANAAVTSGESRLGHREEPPVLATKLRPVEFRGLYGILPGLAGVQPIMRSAAT